MKTIEQAHVSLRSLTAPSGRSEKNKMKGSGSKTKASVAAALLEEPIELGSSGGEHLEPRSAATAELSGALATGPLCPNIYNKACKCKKDNPNCLAGIIPGPSGFRKKGLWQKDTKALLAQGHDPNDDLKEVSFLAQSSLNTAS